MRYKPDSKVLVFVTRKMIKEWCERQVHRKVLGDSHLKNLDNWLKKIGRCANIIYKDSKDVTSVYLFADKEFRIKHIMERDGISEKEAEKYIKEVDEKRTSFHKYCTDTVWGDAKEYQLCLDTGKIGFEKTAELIMNYINAKKES